jgi:hypothetical protein
MKKGLLFLKPYRLFRIWRDTYPFQVRTGEPQYRVLSVDTDSAERKHMGHPKTIGESLPEILTIL